MEQRNFSFGLRGRVAEWQPPPEGDTRAVVHGALYFAIAAALLWVFVDVSNSTGQWGDHFEQFTWAHSVEWGYHKHPPLPTWILALAIKIFGPSTSIAFALAALCTVGTIFFTHRVATAVLGPVTAALAILVLGLQQAFSGRASLFNHNTVLLFAVSVTAWCLLKALRHGRRQPWWLGVGLAAGCALLAKYQAVIALAGMFLGVALAGELASRSARRGLLLAAAAAAIVVVPHVAWLLQHEQSTLTYAIQSGTSLSAPERAGSVLSFLAQQVRLSSASIVFALILVAASLGQDRRSAPADNAAHQRGTWWLFGLVAFPLLATISAAPLFGLKLQNHWGYQCLQFLALWIAWRIRFRVLPARAFWITSALAVHCAFIAIAVFTTPAGAGSPGRRLDLLYPAQQLAEAVRRDWQDDSICPLRLVVGPSFEAGIVSVYTGGTAGVLEDGAFSKSPWLTPADLQARGAVYVATDERSLPKEGVTRTGSMDVSQVSSGGAARVYWAIVPPETCTDGP